MENFETVNGENDFSDVNKVYAATPKTIVMFTDTSAPPRPPAQFETSQPARPKHSTRKAIVVAKGTISILSQLSVFICLAMLVLTYQNHHDILQELQRVKVTPTLSAAPLSHITVDGCTQVQITLSQYSGGFVIQACWDNYCGEPAIGNCQPQVLQQAITNFKAANPPCLAGTTTAPATSNPVPTTSSQSTFFVTVGGCTHVSVWEWSGSGVYIVDYTWNGYFGRGEASSRAVALEQALANFEAANPPCLAGTTTTATTPFS